MDKEILKLIVELAAPIEVLLISESNCRMSFLSPELKKEFERVRDKARKFILENV